nr:hypothetical protein [Desulfobulbaceae bacterium]
MNKSKKTSFTTVNARLLLKQWLTCCLMTFTLLTVIPGCSSKDQIRHLASDAILIVPQQSTSKEVLSLLGQPVQRRELADGTEEWIYFHKNQSLLRKTPFIGDKFGREEFDLVIIHIKADIVKSCTYRLLTEEDFKSSGIKSDHQLHAE